MFRSNLSTTFRQLVKEKLYVGINAFGLAIGLATCFLIYSWVRFETSFDTQYPDRERIYRVVTQWDDSSEPGFASTYPMIRNRVLSQFPEVESSARLFNVGFLGSKTRIAYLTNVFTDTRFYYGDSNVLSLFGFPMIAGDPATALVKPNAVVLTRTMAKRFFGDLDPLGKVIQVGTSKIMEVTGVMEDLPPNAHFHFDVLASMQAHPWIKGAEDNVWSGIVFHTYVKLREGALADELESKIADLLDDFPNDPEHVGADLDLRLQPVTDIHLTSNRKFELEANGDITYIYLFTTIALLVLFVAIMNYTNLATARHTQRFKEVGVRKVLGATRQQLILQFLTESLVIMGMAFCVAAFLVEITRPLLLVVSGQSYFSNSFLQPQILLTAAGITLLIGILTGASPAIALSGFQPISLFRPAAGALSRGITMRKILIVVQFSVSIALTICTAITYRQIAFLRDAKLGYDADHVIVLDINLPGVRENLSALKTELLKLPGVIGATAASQLPTDIQSSENIDISTSETRGAYCVSVDPDFFDVMGITVRRGKELIESIRIGDTVNHFVINQSARNSIGWDEDDVVNKRMSIRHGNQRPGPVMGLIEDFHFQSLHHTINPLVFEFDPDSYQYLLVKVRGERLNETINQVSASWKRAAGDIPFDFQFLDQQYNNLYKTEQGSSVLFAVFAVVAVFISLLGLFGLSAFSMERRTKEIGMRKILGANAWRVMMLVSKDFLVLVLISFVIALPLGLMYREKWLSHFAFRVDVGVEPFVLSGLINVVLALLTLLYHSIRISKTNPAETLRYE